jgi:hypothetical protein
MQTNQNSSGLRGWVAQTAFVGCCKLMKESTDVSEDRAPSMCRVTSHDFEREGSVAQWNLMDMCRTVKELSRPSGTRAAVLDAGVSCVSVAS